MSDFHPKILDLLGVGRVKAFSIPVAQYGGGLSAPRVDLNM